MAVADAPSTSARVRRQYEFLPYPHRDPEDEKKRLLLTGLDDLNCVNHYCYRGKRNVSAGFRALIAGGGTGDAVVFLAHQLRKTMSEIVYIDLSTASQSVARKRLAARGLENRVKWINGSLLDLPRMGLGKFDYINCSGVLHHLACPDDGLAALRSVLKDDGAMGLMVYGQYGRTGVYQMQSLFRLIGDRDADMGTQVTEVRELMATLPPPNWYKRGADLFSPVESVSDSEVLDLFRHTQDRAYTVPQLYDFLDGAGLHLTEWSSESRIWYQPTVAFRDPALMNRVLALPRREREGACELFWGSIVKHALWATPKQDTITQWTDPEVVPTWTRTGDLFGIRKSLVEATSPDWCFNMQCTGGTKIQVRINADDVTRKLIDLTDGYRTVDSIVAQVVKEFPERSPDQLRTESADVFRLLNSHDLLVLRHRSVPFVAP